MSIRVLVADDHRLFRSGLIRMLGDLPEIVVAAEAGNGQEVIDIATRAELDVLLLDFNMPGPSGFALIEKLHELQPELPILMLSMHDEPGTVRRALKCGASGFISKDVDAETVLAALKSLAQGDRYIDPRLAVSLALSDQNASDREPPLTARERQVLHLIVKGFSLNHVAKQLNLSPKTVTTHKANLMGKLGIKNNSELIRYALENGYGTV